MENLRYEKDNKAISWIDAGGVAYSYLVDSEIAKQIIESGVEIDPYVVPETSNA